MRISDWSSGVCSSDLEAVEQLPIALPLQAVVAAPPLALEQVDRMGVGAEAGGQVEVVIVGIVAELPEAGAMPGVDELAVAFLVVPPEPADIQAVLSDARAHQLQPQRVPVLALRAQRPKLAEQGPGRVAEHPQDPLTRLLRHTE